jgi:hypothetical protein
MIGPADEFFVHQMVAPLAQVNSASPHWQDRFYFNFNDSEGRLAGILAMGFFPNTNIFQGILNLAVGDKLLCKNYFRPLGNDRLHVRAGSLLINVAEPLHSWTIKLEEPALEVFLDLVFTGRTPPHEFERITFERQGEIVWDQCHYTQAGVFTGRLAAGGRALERRVGVRDRSWGIRNMGKIDFWVWLSANFPQAWLTAWLGQTADGKTITADGALIPDHGPRQLITAIDYDISFPPGKRTPSGARFILGTADGQTFSLSARPLHDIYVSIFIGVYDLGDPKVRAEKDKTTLIFDQVQAFELEGERGVGMAEFFTVGGCSKYPQWSRR